MTCGNLTPPRASNAPPLEKTYSGRQTKSKIILTHMKIVGERWLAAKS